MGNNINKSDLLQIRINDCITATGAIDFNKLADVKRAWERAECNIAFIGGSGVGKSSLINNLLGVSRKSNAEEHRIKQQIKTCRHSNPANCKHTYAPTSSSECTTDPVPYSFVDNTTVYLWDLPGYGAEIAPNVERFWKQFEVGKYDAFVYISYNNRIYPREKEVVQRLLTTNKPIIWVRTFFESAMNGKSEQAEDAERRKIQNDFMANMGIGSQPTVYCISGLYQPGNMATRQYVYDLNDLKAAVICCMSEEKQLNIATKFKGYSKKLIEAKFNVLQRWALIEALTNQGRDCSRELFSKYIDKVVAVYGFTSMEDLVIYFEVDPMIAYLLDTQLKKQLDRIKATTKPGVLAGMSFFDVFGLFVPGLLLFGPISLIGWTFSQVNTQYRDFALKFIKHIDINIGKKTHCNIAIIGLSGVGKSSLINNLLGVPRKSDEEQVQIVKEIQMCKHAGVKCNHTYAPTSSSETTAAPVPYYVLGPNMPLCLWDLPGYGAQFFSDESQFWKQFDIANNYDAYIYISRNNRLSPEEKVIIPLLVNQSKAVFWVRTYFESSALGKSTADIELERTTIVTEFFAKFNISAETKVYCVSGLYQPGNEATDEYLYDLNDLKVSLGEICKYFK